ncbi:MAG: hypothetical protein ACM3VX_05190 [Bacteroidota bacterium]
MTANQEKKLDQLRTQYRSGKLTPQEYIEKALTLRDGDSTRQKVMEKLSRQLGEPLVKLV